MGCSETKADVSFFPKSFFELISLFFQRVFIFSLAPLFFQRVSMCFTSLYFFQRVSIFSLISLFFKESRLNYSPLFSKGFLFFTSLSFFQKVSIFSLVLFFFKESLAFSQRFSFGTTFFCKGFSLPSPTQPHLLLGGGATCMHTLQQASQ